VTTLVECIYDDPKWTKFAQTSAMQRTYRIKVIRPHGQVVMPRLMMMPDWGWCHPETFAGGKKGYK
ncbi:unnamed protein product, partial [Polarella glacialis]